MADVLLNSAQHCIVVNMFGYDDDELNKILLAPTASQAAPPLPPAPETQ